MGASLESEMAAKLVIRAELDFKTCNDSCWTTLNSEEWPVLAVGIVLGGLRL